jgi:hypothetical protein
MKIAAFFATIIPYMNETKKNEKTFVCVCVLSYNIETLKNINIKI